jgi:hypothetical protein
MSRLDIVPWRHIFGRFWKDKYLVHNRCVSFCILPRVTGDVIWAVFNSPDINIGNAGKMSDDTLNAPVPLKIGEAFAVVIYCTAPHVDQKSRSKWARALRYAATNKPDDESIKKFIKRKGGINACASRYAEYVRRPSKV